MIVVAVQREDVDAGFRHAPGQLPKLSRHRLLQSLDHDIAYGDHFDPGRFKDRAGAITVVEQEMRSAVDPDDPGAAALDAHSGAAERLPHLGERAGSIPQPHFDIVHVRQPPQSRTGSQRTSDLSDRAM